jgi:hypothetical protein
VSWFITAGYSFFDSGDVALLGRKKKSPFSNIGMDLFFSVVIHVANQFLGFDSQAKLYPSQNIDRVISENTSKLLYFYLFTVTPLGSSMLYLSLLICVQCVGLLSSEFRM